MIEPEVLTALIGLLTIILAGAFAYVREKKVEAEEQGDAGFDLAEEIYDVIRDNLNDVYPDEVEKLGRTIDAVRGAWVDSKVKTPEFKDYLAAALKVIAVMKR